MKSLRRTLTLLACCAALTACGPSPDVSPRTAPPSAIDASGVHTRPLSWGDEGSRRSGVAVQLSRPDTVTATRTVAAESALMVGKEIAWDVLVRNDSLGAVRIGVHGRTGLEDMPPVDWERFPPVPRGGAATFRRALLAPHEATWAVVQVAATVDGMPVPVGWLYAGEIA